MALAQARSSQRRIYTRPILLALFLILTLPILPLVAANTVSLRWLFAVDLFVRAIPLYVAWCADVAFYDAGELSPAFIPVWVILTGLLLFPLLLLAIRPSLWRSRKWRATITVYAMVAAIGTGLAAIWVFTHLGIFF